MPALLRSRLLVVAAAVALPAHAAEGGGSGYAGGPENFLSGAAPPPGFHLLAYGQHDRAGTAHAF